MTRRCLASAAVGSLCLWALLAAVVLMLSGCAVGRGPAGEIVTGVKIGELVESAGEAARAAAGFLPPPFDYAATALLGIVGGGGIAGARARRQGERDGWEEAAATYSPPPRLQAAVAGPDPAAVSPPTAVGA